MPFYRFHQNNSGGHFDQTRELDATVFIEADDAKQANTIATSVGIYFDGVEAGQDCDCCGDRWTPVGEDNLEAEPRLDRDTVIHLASGLVARPKVS